MELQRKRLILLPRVGVEFFRLGEVLQIASQASRPYPFIMPVSHPAMHQESPAIAKQSPSIPAIKCLRLLYCQQETVLPTLMLGLGKYTSSMLAYLSPDRGATQHRAVQFVRLR